MEAPAMLMEENAADAGRLGDVPPPKFADEELDLLAYELWQLASCPERALEPAESSAAKEAWCHASCV